MRPKNPKSKPATIHRLCLIGVGLIGGSLARGLKKIHAVNEVVGYARSMETLRQARNLGVIDRVAEDYSSAVHEADMVVVATPVGAMEEVFPQIAESLPETAVVTDVGSVKGAVVEAARKAFGRNFARFVPGHPIAGIERSGVAASFAELFENRRVILTPCEETRDDALVRVRRMWEVIGSTVVTMPVVQHDRTLAATSHLPHVLAYTLVDLLARIEGREAVFEFAAGGFYDFTRIASSDPVMWRDICVANRDNLSEILYRYRDALDKVIAMVKRGDAELLMELFARAKLARDTLLSPDSKNASPE